MILSSTFLSDTIELTYLPPGGNAGDITASLGVDDWELEFLKRRYSSSRGERESDGTRLIESGLSQLEPCRNPPPVVERSGLWVPPLNERQAPEDVLFKLLVEDE